MRVRASMVVAAVVGLLLACDETRIPSVAGVRGATDITIANDLLFITATDENELRVVDLTLRVPDFVRAPNPLNPLSIPVADRPVQLARDVVWDDNGIPNSGRYVYSLSANAQQVSVVGAARESLVTLATVHASDVPVAPGVPSNGTITAIAASAIFGQPSFLYLALFEAPNTRIVRIQLPSENLTEESLDASLIHTDTDPELVATYSCGAVLSMVVLPQERLAYGGRRTPEIAGCETTNPAETAFLHEGTTETLLQFGTPVRKLFTNPRAEGSANFEQGFAEGERIYGVIDEEACEPAGCGGVLTVVGPNPRVTTGCNAVVGARACGPNGLVAPPVSVGTGLIMGADVTAGSSIAMPSFVLDENPSRLQGVLTTSDGRMVFWDAGNLRHFDLDLEPPLAESVALIRKNGTPVPAAEYVPGPRLPNAEEQLNGIRTVLGHEGITRDESIALTFLGNLPGLTGAVLPAGSTSLAVPVDPTGLVEQGDLVYGLDTTACPGAAEVTAVAANPGGGGTLTLSAALSPTTPCAVAVRPNDAAATRWVAIGSASGYLGRFAPGANIELPASQERRQELYYRYPATLAAGAPLAPVLTIVEFLDPGAAVNPGDFYEIITRARTQPAVVVLNESVARSRGVRPNYASGDVAGAAAYRHGTNELMVAFPSGDVVLRFGTNNLVAGSPTTEGLENPFR